MAGKGGDLRPDAFGQRRLAQIRPPGPCRNRHMHLALARIEAHLPIAEIDDRPDITGFETIDAHGFHDGVHQLLPAERDIQKSDVGGLEQTVDMLGKPENSRPARALITPDAFENGEPVMQGVGQDVDLGIVPVHPRAVHPDFLARGQHGLGDMSCGE